LVFLVESEDEHANAVLLLDEPGHSLHARAQRDLSLFFNGLAEQNQLVYTAHSPFLIDADHLDRAKKVFVAEDGTSKASADLNAAEGSDVSVRGAGYTVHAAVGLTISESLLLGCIPIVVEGSSDQHYLNGIKTLLGAAGRIKPGREYVFPPAGGVKGVKPLVSVLGARDGELPVVFIDSDKAGRDFAVSLKNGLYKGNESLIFEVGNFVAIPEAEIEDLIPQDLIVWTVDRWHRTAAKPFEDVVKANEAVVPQIESWAVSQGITLGRSLAGRLSLQSVSRRISLIEG
jgi:predicted ATP-dependent endonuclease of OLD family